MCSRSVTNLSCISQHSSLGKYFPVEVSEPHLESAKLLQEWAASYSGGHLARPPLLPVGQILQALHASQGEWSLPRPITSLPQQAVGSASDGYFLSDHDKHLHTTCVDAHTDASCKKFAHAIPLKKHGLTRDLINTLPDELLCQIFHFLPRARDRAACASVSRRWLMLQSHMGSESMVNVGAIFDGAESLQRELDSQKALSESEVDDHERVGRKIQWGRGDLSRCLAGRKASDVRLAAIAVGTRARGGLGKLCIRGGSAVGLKVGVTDVGLSAIGFCCSALRVLSLWDCPNIKDESLSIIGKGCRLLEKVDLFKCPLLGDFGLQSIAKNCSRLSFLSFDECELFSDKSLIAFGECCPNVVSLSIRNCLLISDDGLMAAICNLKRLKMMKLEGLRISDKSLASIGLHSKALIWLNLDKLDLVSAEGFMLFGMAAGVQFLKRLLVTSCKNLSDDALGMLGKFCCGLKHISLAKCESITDEGLAIFMQNAASLEVLQIEKCNLITGTGLVAALSSRSGKLRDVQVRKCEGIKKVRAFSPSYSSHDSTVESICLADCPGVGDLYLALVGWLCPKATKLDFSGLTDITDEGLLAFFSSANRKLTSVKVSGCVKLTDRSICVIAHQCGQSLRNLVLDGCKMVSDKTLKAIASHCVVLEDLDVSQCTISNEGLRLVVDATGQTFSSLNLSGCGGISEKILPLIQKKCDCLLDLNLKNCRGMTERVLVGFESRMQRCTVLY